MPVLLLIHRFEIIKLTILTPPLVNEVYAPIRENERSHAYC